LSQNFDDLFVCGLEPHGFVGTLVETSFQLNDKHHVVILENNGLGDLGNRLD
jgi:hypothetical protein